jgi:hypothetical protein
MADVGSNTGKTNAATRPVWFRLAWVVVVVEVVALVAVIAAPRSSDVKATKTPTLVAAGASDNSGPRGLHRQDVIATTTTVTSAPPAPTTTVPAPTTTTPPVPVTTAPPPAPVPKAAAAGAGTGTAAPGHAILPPENPPASIAPAPDFLKVCSETGYDDSGGCTASTVAAIDNGRRAEGLPGMTLPSNWGALTPEEQLYVATNLERTVRGLPALSAMATVLDGAAGAGAASGDDPSPPAGFPFIEWGANWAGGVGGALEAVYYWMYDDGPGSSNADCSPGDPGGCWGHRDKILMSLSCTPCVMGTGFDGTGWGGQPSWAELLVGTTGAPAVEFTWEQEAPYLA